MDQQERERQEGEWKDEAPDFDAYKEAIRQVLDKQEWESQWTVELEVRRVGNPIHQYRIVLKPAG
jgi:hypothetical protein